MAADQLSNKQKVMAERVGVGFIDAGPPSPEMRGLLVDEAYKMRIVERETFVEKLLRISNLNVHENLAMAHFLIANATQIGRRWDFVIADEYFYPILACIHEQWATRTAVLNTKLQFQHHTLPPWPFPAGGGQTDDLTFLQRLQNQFWGPVLHLFFKYWTVRRIRNGAEALCHSCSVDFMTEAPAVYIPQIVVTAIGLEYPRPLSPLAEYVGPLLSRIPQTIPHEMEAWLDSQTPQSVVYISMGSLYPLTADVARAIVAGVTAANRSALWSLRKTNAELTMQGVEVDSKRFFISQWTPQVAVVNHRAVGMAIIHGGMSGLHEVALAGVPAILVPLSSDQFATAVRLQHSSAGLMLDFRSISSEKIAEAVLRVDSVEFRQAVRRLGRVFEHAGGAERAADLVEFYANIGYDHLVPAYARHQWSWLQYYNVDVYCTLLACAVVLFGLAAVLGCHCRNLVRALWGKYQTRLKPKRC